jgi:signal transduction histidine kinase
MTQKRSARSGTAAQAPAGIGAPGGALLLIDARGTVQRADGWREVVGSPAPREVPAPGESPDALLDALASTLEEARQRHGTSRRFVEIVTEKRRYFALAAAPADGGDAGAGLAALAFDITDAFRIGPQEGQAIRDLGHDLRTPLTSLSGAVELLQTGRMGTLTAEQDRLLGMMQQSLLMMLTLIEEATAPYRHAAGNGGSPEGGAGPEPEPVKGASG